MRVQILERSTATLQSTLLHRRNENSNELPKKIMFVSDSVVAVYCSDLIVIWDLNRGVVASTTQPKKEHVFHDAVPHNGKVYAIVWSMESKKAQIHCIKPETGKAEQKIKAGKGAVLALAVTDNVAVVRQEDAVRVLNLTTGEKVAKYTSLKTSSEQLVAGGDFLVTIDSGEAIFLNSSKGKQIGSLPLEDAEDTLAMWSQPKEQGFYLRVGSKIYIVSKDGTERVLQSQITAAPDVNQRIILGHSNAVHALLQNGNQFQTCEANVQEDEIELNWVVPESKEKKTAKRKDAAMVLGPGQSGGQASGLSDGPAPKKRRSDSNQEEDDIEMAEGDDDGLDKLDKADQGPSIAERLKKLHEAFDAEEEEEDGDDDNDDKDDKSSFVFKPKKATTESLTQLLDQALQSSDDGMLELALKVRDAKVLQETCSQLSDEHLLTLLNALTSRLAAKSSRAGSLCPWIAAVVSTGRARSIPHLQPLRNILEERVTVFPSLLKLEGRLGMMINQ